ncbi:hypothetical protein [uncultured Aquimarina sp.]|uniref:hypothetical protein n=1 Tax=uncultured Aquimarina sp. TaxID=575652 RepID=UPI00260EAD27|nr:hypothetical protein [uncultured Aquimarina sp.]
MKLKKTFCAIICFIENLAIGFAQTITLEMELDNYKIQQGDYISLIKNDINNNLKPIKDEN